jgi:hypothetical protein
MFTNRDEETHDNGDDKDVMLLKGTYIRWPHERQRLKTARRYVTLPHCK